MRILKNIIIGAIVILIVCFVGIIVFLKTIDVSRFKSQIAHQISLAIERDVKINEIRLS